MMEQLAASASAIVGSAEGPFDVSYTRRDLLLYALGIGATELRYIHEANPGFCAFPTYPLVLPYKGTSSDVVPFPGELGVLDLRASTSACHNCVNFQGKC